MNWFKISILALLTLLMYELNAIKSEISININNEWSEKYYKAKLCDDGIGRIDILECLDF